MDNKKSTVPVILDTDLGDDIDDTWAIGMMLKCREIEPLLIVTCWGNTTYRTKLLSKLLTVMNREDIPIGTGKYTGEDKRWIPYDGPQGEWIKDYDIKEYKGHIYENGVKAMVDIIMKSESPITLISIGPMTNIAAALELEPKIKDKVKLVAMQGSVRKGYNGSSTPIIEYNVRKDIAAAKLCFSTCWKYGMVITPLDTCGVVRIEGSNFKKLKEDKDPFIVALMDNFYCWSISRKLIKEGDELKVSSILFDTVAIFLAFREDWLVIEELNIYVTDDGRTVIDNERGNKIRVATDWTSLSAYIQFLVSRILAPTLPPLPRNSL